MDREILQKLIYKTKLINNSFLKENEKAILNLYINKKEALTEIGKQLNVTEERICEILQIAYDKLFFTIKNFNRQAKQLESLIATVNQLVNEIKALRSSEEKKKNKQLQLSLSGPENKYLSEFKFSARAIGAFRQLNITTLNQLKQYTKWDFSRLRNVGTQTINEIFSLLEEQGVQSESSQEKL